MSTTDCSIHELKRELARWEFNEERGARDNELGIKSAQDDDGKKVPKTKANQRIGFDFSVLQSFYILLRLFLLQR